MTDHALSLAEVDEWLGRYRALWEQRLDALHTEVAWGNTNEGGRDEWQCRKSRCG